MEEGVSLLAVGGDGEGVVAVGGRRDEESFLWGFFGDSAQELRLGQPRLRIAVFIRDFSNLWLAFRASMVLTLRLYQFWLLAQLQKGLLLDPRQFLQSLLALGA